MLPEPKRSIALNSSLRSLYRSSLDTLPLNSLVYFSTRCNWLDTLLRDVVNIGGRQVVILGSGYDSRPYRFPSVSYVTDDSRKVVDNMENRVVHPSNADMDVIQYFEVDRAEVIQMKQELIANIGIPITAHHNVEYLAIDLNKPSASATLTRALSQSPNFNTSLPTLFIAEGMW